MYMGFRFFMKTRLPKTFQYQPLYYDERKESLEKLVERVKAEEKGKIPSQHEIKFDRKHGVSQTNRKSNIRIMVIIAVLAAVVYLFLR